MERILEVEDVYSGYGQTEILHGVSISLGREEIVTIIGPNGAGKSTLFKTIVGYLIPTKGRITFQGEDVTYLPPHEKVIKGMGYVPQLKNTFTSLSILENLEMGGYHRDSKKNREKIEELFAIFPVLAEKKHNKARTMSGGQRQMLALARALMMEPSILLLDEPSAGLDPQASRKVFDRVAAIHKMGTAIIIIEQDAYQSLKISHRCYVLAEGQNEHEGQADRILEDEAIKEAYLGS